MKKVNVIFKYTGVICIPIYTIFTYISHLFNTKINPLTNWLSDFGNPFENPSGAIFYNTGCIIVAALLIVFYIGIFQWYRNHKIRKQYIICYAGAQISGVIASVFLILASIFPIGAYTFLHSTFSLMNMIGMDSFIIFTSIAFLLNHNIKKWIGIYGFLSAFFNIITMNAFSSFYISEWIYFLLFMAYIVAITLNYNKIIKYEIGPAGKDLGDDASF